MEHVAGFDVQSAMDASHEETRVLVVDDDPINRNLHRALLAKQFNVVTAASGIEAIEACQQQLPDLVLLDIEMPELGGIETCHKLREWADIPIIFLTSHQSLDEQLAAYDAGGNDIIVKPVDRGILLHKVRLAITQFRRRTELLEEKNALQSMAMAFLSSAGQNGALLNFMRGSLECVSHADLARNLCDTAADQNIQCTVMLRHEGGPTFMTTHGEASAIERSILERSTEMGRIFQFRRQLVVNYDRVSIIVANLPDGNSSDSEAVGRVRDNIAILAEITEALCNNVDMRKESIRRAEQLQLALTGSVNTVETLREKYMAMLGDTRLLLQDLVGKIEKSYGWLGTSEAQEERLSRELNESVQEILRVLAEGGNFDQQFSEVLAVLRGGDPSIRTEVELF